MYQAPCGAASGDKGNDFLTPSGPQQRFKLRHTKVRVRVSRQKVEGQKSTMILKTDLISRGQSSAFATKRGVTAKTLLLMYFQTLFREKV